MQEKIASAFVGRFRCGLQRFYGKEKPFAAYTTDLKIVTSWRYGWFSKSRENFKNLRK